MPTHVCRRIKMSCIIFVMYSKCNSQCISRGFASPIPETVCVKYGILYTGKTIKEANESIINHIAKANIKGHITSPQFCQGVHSQNVSNVMRFHVMYDVDMLRGLISAPFIKQTIRYISHMALRSACCWYHPMKFQSRFDEAGAFFRYYYPIKCHTRFNTLGVDRNGCHLCILHLRVHVPKSSVLCLEFHWALFPWVQ